LTVINFLGFFSPDLEVPRLPRPHMLVIGSQSGNPIPGSGLASTAASGFWISGSELYR
jgi:hypothetical protein